MLLKGLSSHPLYNSVLYLSCCLVLKLYVCDSICYGMLYCICIGLVELSVIVQVHHINNKYNNSCKGK